MAALHLVNAGPSEEMLARGGSWNGELLIELKNASAENIARKLEENADASGIGAPHRAIAQQADIEFSLVDWFFFGGECFDGYILYDSIAKEKTGIEKQRCAAIADRYNEAYSIAKARATELVKSMPIVDGTDNCRLVKYFLTSWLHSMNPMQIHPGIWRQYKGVILVALTVYYNVAVRPGNSSHEPDVTTIQFYKSYARTIKAVVQPQQ